MRIEKGSIRTKDNEHQEQLNVNISANKKQNFMMFLSIFMVLLIIFLGFAKMLSPDIDITLGDDSENYREEENINEVDSRLKALQAEDEEGVIDEEILIEEDGLVRIPKKEDSAQKQDNTDEVIIATPQEDTEPVKQESSITVQTPEVVKAPVLPASNKTYRVYVGTYSSQAQAEVARGILQEAGLGVSPTIKQVGGGYTLQVGAFSSKESANNLSNKLLMNNYPSRVVSD